VTSSPLRSATSLPLERELVLDCLDAAARPLDALFKEAFCWSLASLEPRRRGGALAGTTGHVAESVAEVILVDCGWSLVWQHVGPGPQGVDLMFPHLTAEFADEERPPIERRLDDALSASRQSAR
jgi:hypothetical protein